MGNIVGDIERKYRDSPKYGVTFSIDASAYECRLGDRVMFGDNYTYMECGRKYNWQNIYLDMKGGQKIGYVEESVNGKLLDPMCVSFCIDLADCQDEETWKEMEEKYKGNPHLSDLGETLRLEFATLNQLLDHLKL